MRAFVAVEAGVPGDPAPAHLTLRFLGDLADGAVPEVARVLGPVARGSAPFPVELAGVGAFPSSDRPRVVWVGVREGRAALVDFAGRVADALTPFAGPAERGEFVPHLTLFRVRSPADRARARALLDGDRPPPEPRTVRVTEFVLFESRLTRTGAIHRAVERFPLGGAPTGP